MSDSKVIKSLQEGKKYKYLGILEAQKCLRYSAAFVSWRKSELQGIDRKTRKLFTIHGALHPESNVDRLYIYL